MPVNFTLLFCIPIGILYYFAARWSLRFFLGRYEQKERRVRTPVWGLWCLVDPLNLLLRLVGDAVSGRFGQTIAGGLFAVAALGLVSPLLKTLMKGKWRNFDSNH